MYNANSQNTQLRLRTELANCNYNPNMKDYLANMIMEIMNFPKKTTQPRHFVKNMNQDKIIMVWYQMSIPFMKKNYNVPLLIYIMKNCPYEPPQIFLEVVQGSAPNPANKDVDPNTRRIMTNTLRNWGQYSTIDSAMSEIYESFSKTFPIYKTSGKPNQNSAYQQQQKRNSEFNANPGFRPNQHSGYNPNPNQNPMYGNNNSGASGGGGIYDVLNNAVNNAYQQNKYGGYQQPPVNFYGRRMTMDDKSNNNNPNSFGGGIYGQNNNNNFGQGGIYGNQNNNNNMPPSPAYNNNNNKAYNNNNFNNNYNTNNQYGNNNYNNQYGSNNQFGNNNNKYGNNNQFSNNNNNQYGYNNQKSNYMGVSANPDEEFKKILINEISGKIAKNIIEDKKILANQNQILNQYKAQLESENDKIQNFVNHQNQIKMNCEEDLSNINNALKNTKDYIDNNKTISLNTDNCLNFIDVPDSSALKVIANESNMEEMILVVKRAFERKKIGLPESIIFMRKSAIDLFKIKFLKNKVIKKYEGHRY